MEKWKEIEIINIGCFSSSLGYFVYTINREIQYLCAAPSSVQPGFNACRLVVGPLLEEEAVTTPILITVQIQHMCEIELNQILTLDFEINIYEMAWTGRTMCCYE